MTTPSGPQPDRRSPDPITRALEVAVYAPIGVAAYVREMGPDVVRTVVARGRAEVEVRQEQVANGLRHAKGAGEVAIAFGLPVLRRRMEARLSSMRPAPEPAPRTPTRRAAKTGSEAAPPVQSPPAAAVAADVHTAVTQAADASGPNGQSAAEKLSGTAGTAGSDGDERLAIPGYDALSASQVVERLAGLGREELAAVRDYEAGHRRRRTILGKIEQLSV
ncbi:MAG: hypothetical protein QOH10_2621 [Actinomycetota bacterium]|jgi:hypothetical protein|nr:hypothetical protein [Actinomycetota bacterium]